MTATVDTMTATELLAAPEGRALLRDLKASTETMTAEQGRFLVDLYYQLQEHRKGLKNQERSLEEAGEPAAVVAFFGEQVEALEKRLPPIMGEWAARTEVGRWSQAQVGIGPILSAGLLAHLRIEKAPTAGALWRFAGLDPSVTWGKGERRPWNADLKVLCWRIGDSFVKQSGRGGAFYGHLFRQRKVYEVERDLAGGNAAAAAEALLKRNIVDKALRAKLVSGHLSDGQLNSRAQRWAVKLFLAHWQLVAWVERYGVLPVAPYPVAQLGHAHEIVPPHLPDRVRRLMVEAGRMSG